MTILGGPFLTTHGTYAMLLATLWPMRPKLDTTKIELAIDPWSKKTVPTGAAFEGGTWRCIHLTPMLLYPTVLRRS